MTATAATTATAAATKAATATAAAATKDPVLKVNNISVSFEGFLALSDVQVDVQRNTIHFFIGPNGAGKTTLLDIICGKTRPSAGTVTYFPQGREMIRLTDLKEYRIVNVGVGRKFQMPSIFINLTVWDNMILSLKGHKGVWDSIFFRPSAAERADIEQMLERFDLLEQRDTIAGALAHGQKQRLEIAMQLVQKPELIMLDEPAAGMGKQETFQLGEVLREICGECTVIVVEHDMEFVKQIADVVTVFHEGKVLMEGSISEVLADETVQAVYLGRGGER
ncbi:MAG: urea ABC transporter ATP-binding protein UrtD [Coriobacteriales bacterium]|jgi:urea transport system ATP-binding protein|nr:urea ABC transporter ATP-binding protein UrtD [Coriobacteriales bacterium]